MSEPGQIFQKKIDDESVTQKFLARIQTVGSSLRMDGSEGNNNPADNISRWTCEACGCVTNSNLENPTSCSIVVVLHDSVVFGPTHLLFVTEHSNNCLCTIS
jgi:hypothetical protein